MSLLLSFLLSSCPTLSSISQNPCTNYLTRMLKVVDFNGERTLEGLSQFVETGGDIGSSAKSEVGLPFISVFPSLVCPLSPSGSEGNDFSFLMTSSFTGNRRRRSGRRSSRPQRRTLGLNSFISKSGFSIYY